MKYKILLDYGSEGHSFTKEEYETVNEAVKAAVADHSYTKFLIVVVIDWQAQAV